MTQPSASASDGGGTRRIGRYEVTGEIGRGAMGVVYRALDPAIGRTVALKTIRLLAGVDGEGRADVERLRREAQSGGRSLHPNIVTVFDFFESEGSAFVCMEFVDGPSLERVINSGEALDPEWTVAMLEQVASALDFAHSKGVVHRDIKPANLLLADQRTVKVSDFGIARILSEDATATGPLMGTPSYMSPEQAQSKGVGGRSDQFSLAVIAYELLTGAKAFEGYSLASVVYRVCNETPAAASSLNPALTPAVDGVLARALEKDPAMRFPNVTQFVAALRRTLAESTGWRPQAAGPSGAGATIPVAAAVGAPGEVAGNPGLSLIPRSPLEARAEPRERGIAWRAAIIGFLLAGGSFWVVTQYRNRVDVADLVETAAPVSTDQKPSAAGDEAERPKADLPAGEATDATAEGTGPEAAASGQASAELQPPVGEGRAATDASAGAVPVAGTKPKPEPRGGNADAADLLRPHAVEILSEPAGATVMIDDNPSFTCVTPCGLTLGPGKHSLHYRWDGYRPGFQTLDVPDSTVASMRMEQRAGTVMVKSAPAGAVVIVDGREWRSKTPTMITLPAGRHRIVLRVDGLPDEVSEVEIRDNAVSTLEVN